MKRRWQLWIPGVLAVLIVLTASWLLWRQRRVVTAIQTIIPVYREATPRPHTLKEEGPKLWLMTTPDPPARVIGFYKDEARLGGWHLVSHTAAPSLALLVLQRNGCELVIGVATENDQTQISYLLRDAPPPAHVPR